MIESIIITTVSGIFFGTLMGFTLYRMIKEDCSDQTPRFKVTYK